jgi:hypothetical protein
VQRIQDRVNEARAQQDNEQLHLLVLEELIADPEVDEGRIRYGVIPQIVAFAYYQLSWALYVVRPAWSYALNADFEDHAEHEYMHYVVEHPELEQQAFAPVIAKDYGAFPSQAGLFRQIAHDERVHKEESLAAMAEPRFR